MKKAIALSALLLSAACAKHANEIQTQYVSPLEYKDYSCDQISEEMQRTSRRVSELTGQLDKKADTDSMQMGVGLILFWPTLFFLDGNGQDAQEYARLRGEFEALEKSANKKNCKIDVREVTPRQPEAVKAPESSAYPAPRRK